MCGRDPNVNDRDLGPARDCLAWWEGWGRGKSVSLLVSGAHSS